MRANRLSVDAGGLDAAVHAPGKRRYAYDGTGTRIRAVQGHSVPVDLGYAPSVPPAMLLHAAGNASLLAANGVWLTDRVQPEFLRRLDRRGGVTCDAGQRPATCAAASSSRSSP